MDAPRSAGTGQAIRTTLGPFRRDVVDPAKMSIVTIATVLLGLKDKEDPIHHAASCLQDSFDLNEIREMCSKEVVFRIEARKTPLRMIFMQISQALDNYSPDDDRLVVRIFFKGETQDLVITRPTTGTIKIEIEGEDSMIIGMSLEKIVTLLQERKIV